MNLEKNIKIKESLKATRELRKSQVCKVFELKIDESKLNSIQSNQLKMMFIESKWIYNYVLGQSKTNDDFDVFNINYKDIPIVSHFNKDKELVNVELNYLSAQMLQEIFNEPKANIIKLSKAKKAGLNVGELRFKSEVNSILLKQYNQTYKLIPNMSKIKIQGIKKAIKVRGLDQLDFNTMNFANANLIKKASGYYLKVTTYQNKTEILKTGQNIGIDFGIANNVTLSNGESYNWNFEETKRLKKLQRVKERKVKDSKNRYKTINLINKEYEKLTNKKTDATNKFVSMLVKQYDVIAIQDDDISSWKEDKKKGFGKEIQHSILGRIKAKLKTKANTKVIDQFYASSQKCSHCGSSHSILLNDRIYICYKCGLEINRDTNAAINILNESLSTDGPSGIKACGDPSRSIKQEDAL